MGDKRREVSEQEMTFLTPKAPVLIPRVELSKWSVSGLITHLLRAKRAASTGAFGVKKYHSLFHRALRSNHPFVSHRARRAGTKQAYTALLQCRTFLSRKKWGPQRKDFGGRCGFPVFL